MSDSPDVVRAGYLIPKDLLTTMTRDVRQIIENEVSFGSLAPDQSDAEALGYDKILSIMAESLIDTLGYDPSQSADTKTLSEWYSQRSSSVTDDGESCAFIDASEDGTALHELVGKYLLRAQNPGLLNVLLESATADPSACKKYEDRNVIPGLTDKQKADFASLRRDLETEWRDLPAEIKLRGYKVSDSEEPAYIAWRRKAMQKFWKKRVGELPVEGAQLMEKVKGLNEEQKNLQ